MQHETHDQRTETDCLRCCLATVLGLPYDDVPDFVAEYDVEWREALGAWLDARGHLGLWFQASHDQEICGSSIGGREALWIAGGLSPRGSEHTVVYRGATMLHDPHPSKAGLAVVCEAIVMWPGKLGS